LKLQGELVETEDYVQFARRYYNGSVREFNTRIETVPSNIVAGWFRFTPRSFFQKSSDDAAAVPLVEFGSIE
jgi:LemA protein